MLKYNSEENSMKKYKRVFLIVCDSLGVGASDDAYKFHDVGSNTLLHISQACNGLRIPTLNKLGINDVNNEIIGTTKVHHPNSYVTKISEQSNGKDTMTGHWEMMGVLTTKPFKTFTDTGFPQSLIDELEEKSGHKFIGNYAASGTQIINDLGPRCLQTNEMILYTSADSVLQICANEDTTPIEELYRVCSIAREICMKEEYKVGRVIARPYTGNAPSNFHRTPRRHDYALSPSSYTYMETLKDNNFDVICVGKIGDIFNGVGVSETYKTVSNHNGMEITTQIADRDFEGLCFVNLVEFDSEYGHRRNPIGYGKCIEEFDRDLEVLLGHLKEDDLLIVTADHGNDPTYSGSDHTREKIPFIAYSKLITDGNTIEERKSFADMGYTIIKNFGLDKVEPQIGSIIEELIY